MKPNKYPIFNPKTQSGIAIVTVLLIVVILAVNAGELLNQQASFTRVVQTEKDREQGSWILRSSLEWARTILFNESRNTPMTTLDGLWARPIVGMEIPLPGSSNKALVTGAIQDEQGKFNLLDLNHPEKAHLTRQQLGKLLEMLGMPVLLVSSLENKVHYARAAGFYWRSIQELLSGSSLQPWQQLLLCNHLTLLPASTPLNINTASAEVLSATVIGLDLAEAKELVGQRNQGQWFNSTGDFLNRIRKPASFPVRPLDITSHWFLVQGEVNLDHAHRQLQALLYRPQSGMPVVRWIKE